GFRTPDPNAGLLDAEFEAFQAGHSIIDQPFVPEQHLWQNSRIAPSQPFNTHQQHQEAPNWAFDFQNLHVHEARSTPIPATQFRTKAPLHRGTTPTWHQEFQKQSSESQRNHYQQSRLGGGPFGAGLSASNYNAYSNYPGSVGQQRQPDPLLQESLHHKAFEEAFDAASLDVRRQEQSTQTKDTPSQSPAMEASTDADDSVEYRIGSDRIYDESQERQQESQSKEQEADELAKTAGQLLDNVKHDQSTKFQESNFMILMRQLRDREVKLEGNNFVD
ncbi:MAG: hypothetical protein Q9174_007531, partial [Haloplaca sp. 1 TL-2023]